VAHWAVGLREMIEKDTAEQAKWDLAQTLCSMSRVEIYAMIEAVPMSRAQVMKQADDDDFDDMAFELGIPIYPPEREARAAQRHGHG
jgi:hypothetical protein